jgi:hypothetical protein
MSSRWWAIKLNGNTLKMAYSRERRGKGKCIIVVN